MNKCYFAHEGKERYLVPECWPVINSGNIEDCQCPENPHLAYIEQLIKEGKTEQAKEYRKIYNEQKNY